MRTVRETAPPAGTEGRTADQQPPSKSVTRLPAFVEHRVLAPFSQSPTGRIASKAVLRAMAVLVRRHPKAALHALGAGLSQAFRSSTSEIGEAVSGLGRKRRLTDGETSSQSEEAASGGILIRLSPKQLRRLRRLVDQAQSAKPKRRENLSDDS